MATAADAKAAGGTKAGKWIAPSKGGYSAVTNSRSASTKRVPPSVPASSSRNAPTKNQKG